MLVTAAVLAGATLAGALVSAFAPDRVALTGADLEARLNRTLPRQFHSVTVDRATVGVAEGRITLRVAIRAAVVGRSVATAVAARGVPRWDGDRGAVFFDADDVRIEDAGSGGVVGQLGIHLGGARVEAAADGLLAGAVRAWLAARPVYRFKDDARGVVLRAAIDDVAVDGDRLVIHASLIRLTAAVAGWLCGLLVVVLGAVLVAVPDTVARLAVLASGGAARKLSGPAPGPAPGRAPDQAPPP